MQLRWRQTPAWEVRHQLEVLHIHATASNSTKNLHWDSVYNFFALICLSQIKLELFKEVINSTPTPQQAARMQQRLNLTKTMLYVETHGLFASVQ